MFFAQKGADDLGFVPGGVSCEIAKGERSISYFFAVAWSPNFLIVLSVRVEIRIRMKVSPSGHHSFLVCKLTSWNFRVCAFDLDTLFALFRLVPAMSQALSRITRLPDDA